MICLTHFKCYVLPIHSFRSFIFSQEFPSLVSLNLEWGLEFCIESLPTAKTISPLHETKRMNWEFCSESKEKHHQSLALFLVTINSESSQKQTCLRQQASILATASPMGAVLLQSLQQASTNPSSFCTFAVPGKNQEWDTN